MLTDEGKYRKEVNFERERWKNRLDKNRYVHRYKVSKGVKPLTLMQMALHVAFLAVEQHLWRPLPKLFASFWRVLESFGKSM